MWSPKIRKTARQAGFTLLELLTALTVVSVAVAVLVMLAGRVGDLYREAELRAVAADLAQAKLAELFRVPEVFRWQQAPAGDRLVVVPEGEPAASDYAFAAIPESATRQGRFRWKAFARTITGVPDAMELTVVVLWRDHGWERSLTLTAPMPTDNAMRRAGVPVHAE